MAVGPQGNRKLQTVLAKKYARQWFERFLNRGQGLGQNEIPDEQLQEQRHIAEKLHISPAQAAQQKIARQAANADECAEQRGKHNAQRRYPKGV